MASRLQMSVLTLGLLYSVTPQAAVLTVGPDGTYPTLQAALTIAASNGEADEIRIQCGTFTTHAGAVVTDDYFLEISGSWNSSFSSGTLDPTCTTLNGSGGIGDQYVIEMEASAGEIIIRYLTIANGSAPAGAGLDLDLSGTADIQLSDLIIRNNIASASGAAGGGLRAYLGSVDNRLQILSSQLLTNSAQGSISAEGAAVAVDLTYGEFSIHNSTIAGNTTSAGQETRGGAVAIQTQTGGNATVVIQNSEFRQNTLESQNSTVDGTAINADLQAGGFFYLRSSRVHDNLDQSAGVNTAQVVVNADLATVRIQDTAIVDGLNSGGLSVTTDGTAQLTAFNLTIAGHPGAGLTLASNSVQTQTLMNNILDGNAGGDQSVGGSASINAFANMVRDQDAVDPLFVDRINGDYHLSALSPAINSGWPAIPGGLGQYDADNQPRVVDVSVDKGAYEYVSAVIHADGFE